MNTPKFCKDCKHEIKSRSGDTFSRCALTAATGDYFVTGSAKFEHAYCSSERFYGKCGQDAKHFEPAAKTEAA